MPTDDRSGDGVERDVEHIYVVCDLDGKPHRAYHNRDEADELLDHWRESDMELDGRVEAVDLVEFNRGALN